MSIVCASLLFVSNFIVNDRVTRSTLIRLREQDVQPNGSTVDNSKKKTKLSENNETPANGIHLSKYFLLYI